jgi:hypothetical protein
MADLYARLPEDSESHPDDLRASAKIEIGKPQPAPETNPWKRPQADPPRSPVRPGVPRIPK